MYAVVQMHILGCGNEVTRPSCRFVPIMVDITVGYIKTFDPDECCRDTTKKVIILLNTTADELQSPKHLQLVNYWSRSQYTKFYNNQRQSRASDKMTIKNKLQSTVFKLQTVIPLIL